MKLPTAEELEADPAFQERKRLFQERLDAVMARVRSQGRKLTLEEANQLFDSLAFGERN